MSNPGQRMGKEMLAQVAGIAATLCDRLLVTAFIVRWWGEAGFASWTLIVSAAGMLALFDFGLNYYFSNRLSALVARGRMASALHAFRSGTWLMSAATLIGLAGVVAGFAVYTQAVLPVGREVWLGLFGVLAGTAMHYVTSLYYYLFRAHNQFSTQTLLQAARDFARVLSVVVAVALGASIAETGLAYLAGSFLATVPLLWAVVARRFPSFTLRWEVPNRAERHHARTVGLAYWVQSAATTLITFLPIFLIYGTASALAVAQFALVRTLANFARLAQQLIGLVLGQEAARLITINRSHAVTPLFLRGTRLVGVASACGSAILLALGAPLFRAWTGSTKLFDPTLLAIALVPLALAPTLLFTQSTFLSANRPWPLVRGRLAQVVLSVAGFAFLPIEGAPLRMMCALALAELIGFGLPIVADLKRTLPEIGWGMHGSVTARTASAGGLTYLVTEAVGRAFAPGWPSLTAVVAAGGLATCLSIYFLALEAADRRTLREWVAGRRKSVR